MAAVALLAGASVGVERAPVGPQRALERPFDTGCTPHRATDTLELPSHPLLSPGRRSEPLPAVLVTPARVAHPLRRSLAVAASAPAEAREALPRASRGPPAS